ncbi:hypothetical protein ACP70R_005635 [Stipagrostis hirtigluma subsp. patula]
MEARAASQPEEERRHAARGGAAARAQEVEGRARRRRRSMSAVGGGYGGGVRRGGDASLQPSHHSQLVPAPEAFQGLSLSHRPGHPGRRTPGNGGSGDGKANYGQRHHGSALSRQTGAHGLSHRSTAVGGFYYCLFGSLYLGSR